MAVAFAPDGRTFASVGEGGAVKRWDAETGSELPWLGERGIRGYSAAFSPDGAEVAVGLRPPECSIVVFDAATGREIRRLRGHETCVAGLALSCAGRLASADDDGTIRVWDLAEGRELLRFTYDAALWVPAPSIALSFDGKVLAHTCRALDSTVSVIDVDSGDQRLELDCGEYGPLRMVFSPDGRHLAAPLGATVLVREAETGRAFPRLKGSDATVLSCAFSRDGKMLASGEEDGTIRLWEMTSGRQIGEMKSDMWGVSCLGFSPDGAKIVTGGMDGTVRLWDVAKGKEMLKPRNECYWIHSLSFSADGRRLATVAADNAIRIWETTTGRQVLKLKPNHLVSCVAFSPDGTVLAYGTRDVEIAQGGIVITDDDVAERGEIRLLDAVTGKKVSTLGTGLRPIRSISFSPDGRMLAASEGTELFRLGDECVYVWEVHTGRQMLRSADSSEARAVAFSPDGTTLAAGHSDGTIRVWDVATGKMLIEFGGLYHEVFGLAFLHEGELLVSSGRCLRLRLDSWESVVRTWDVRTGEELSELSDHRSNAPRIAASRDGRFMAAAGFLGTISVRQIARTGKSIRAERLLRFSAGESPATAITFSPDGTRLASAGTDGTAIVWDLARVSRLAENTEGAPNHTR